MCAATLKNGKSLMAGEPINNVMVTFLLNKYDEMCAAPLIKNRKSLMAGEPINNVMVTFLLNK